MEFRKLDQNSFILKIEKNENVLGTLEQFLIKNNIINFMRIHSIGALKNVELGFLLEDGKNYKRMTWKEELEVLSLSGNIARFNNEFKYHLHGVFGNKNFNVVGGHFFHGIVSGTLEVFIDIWNDQLINREIKQHETFPCLSLE